MFIIYKSNACGEGAQAVRREFYVHYYLFGFKKLKKTGWRDIELQDITKRCVRADPKSHFLDFLAARPLASGAFLLVPAWNNG